MGNILTKAYEIEQERIHQERVLYLQTLSRKIKAIDPNSKLFADIVWIEQHKEQILGNKRLISILGQ